MAGKYTYKDWKRDRIITLPEDNFFKNEYFRGLYKEGILSSDELDRIEVKQKWAYDKALQINIKAQLHILTSELSTNKFPERYFLKELENVRNELDEYPFEVERTLNGYEDYKNTRGIDYNEARRISRISKKNSHKGYQVYFLTYKNREWVPNINLLVASLLGFERFIRDKNHSDFIKEQKSRSEVQSRGDYVETITSEEMEIELKDYLRIYKEDREKVYESGKPIVDKFIEYLYQQYPEIIARKSPVKRTLQRRTKKIVDKMTFKMS